MVFDVLGTKPGGASTPSAICRALLILACSSQSSNESSESRVISNKEETRMKFPPLVLFKLPYNAAVVGNPFECRVNAESGKIIAVALDPVVADPPLVIEIDVFVGSKTELLFGLYVRLMASVAENCRVFALLRVVEGAEEDDDDEDSSNPTRCDDAVQCVHSDVSVLSEPLLEELVLSASSILLSSLLFCFCFVLLLNLPKIPFFTFAVVLAVTVVLLDWIGTTELFVPNLHLFPNMLLILSANGQLLKRKLLTLTGGFDDISLLLLLELG